MRVTAQPTVEAEPYVLRKALDSVRRRVRRGERFWLRTLRLALVTAKQTDIARSSKDRKAIEFERSDGTLVRLRNVPATLAGYLLFEVTPVERWRAFMEGRFSPQDLSLRMLSVFYQLDFSFLPTEEFEDHNLYIRKVVYPLAPAVRAALAEAPREARELREATEARWARKVQLRNRSSNIVP